ncbi:MAG: SUF system NifU family Fe-S cluster assembly protein [Acidobacteriota bacterium]|jgi:nitrogen fixation NifU-like protein
MSDLRDLYQEVILDHGKRPRNFGPLEGANRTQEGYNPLCGDRLTVFLQVDESGVVREVTFEGTGCAISTASASMMTQTLRGKTVQQAHEIFRRFHDLVTGKAQPSEDLGKLAVFGGVSEFPLRVKCATLPWHTVIAAVDGSDEPVTTE